MYYQVFHAYLIAPDIREKSQQPDGTNIPKALREPIFVRTKSARKYSGSGSTHLVCSQLILRPARAYFYKLQAFLNQFYPIIEILLIIG